MATIYRKTAKGYAEISTRALKLAPRFRSLLILVDGRRTDDELAALMPTAGVLDALAAGGFVEPVAVTDDTPRARSSSAGADTEPAPPPAPAKPGGDLDRLRRESVRALTDLIGPMAEPLAIRIERTRTPEEFRAAIEVAAQVVANSRGRQQATTFAERFLAT